MSPTREQIKLTHWKKTTQAKDGYRWYCWYRDESWRGGIVAYVCQSQERCIDENGRVYYRRGTAYFFDSEKKAIEFTQNAARDLF